MCVACWLHPGVSFASILHKRTSQSSTVEFDRGYLNSRPLPLSPVSSSRDAPTQVQVPSTSKPPASLTIRITPLVAPQPVRATASATSLSAVAPHSATSPKFPNRPPKSLGTTPSVSPTPKRPASPHAQKKAKISRDPLSLSHLGKRAGPFHEFFGDNFRDVQNLDVSLYLNFNIKKLKTSLCVCGKTSSGPDNVPYEMLRHLDAKGRWFLLYLYNRISRSG